MNLAEFFTPASIAAAYSEGPQNLTPNLGPAMFPARKKAGLDLRWLRGAKGLPVSLMPSAFDAKATFRDRIGVTITEAEMPFFREGFHIKERDRQELLRVADSTDPYAMEIIARVFDDATNLIDGANVVPERMIFGLLFDGKIPVKANGVDYEYNYDKDGAWAAANVINLTGTATWDKPETADPFKDLGDVVQKGAATTGTVLARAIMNSKTFGLLSRSDAVRARYLTASGVSLAYLTAAEAQQVVQSTVGLTVTVYDKQYRDEAGKVHSYVPDGYVAIVPDGALGSTWYGTTPEEADLMGGNTGAEVAIVNTGVAITTITETHPVNVTTLASEIVLPSWERMDECYALKVTEDP